MYIVTATKMDEPGLYAFGPFSDEEAAQRFADQVTRTPGWELDEVPVLNAPPAIATGKARK